MRGLIILYEMEQPRKRSHAALVGRRWFSRRRSPIPKPLEDAYVQRPGLAARYAQS